MSKIFIDLGTDLDSLLGEVESFLQQYEELISSELYEELEKVASKIQDELNK